MANDATAERLSQRKEEEEEEDSRVREGRQVC